MRTETETREPSLLDCLIPVVLLTGMMSLAVYLFGEDAAWGPNQIALTLCA
jgi:NhaC family Na+:H+ antiporter